MTNNIRFPAVMPVLLLQAFAGANIENRDREEGERRNDENGVEHDGCPPVSAARSELHENREVQAVLDLFEVWRPQTDRPAAAQGSQAAIQAHQRARRADGIAKRRRDPSLPRPVRHIRRAMRELPPERNVLAWHVIERGRSIPGFERIARVLSEIRRAGGSCRTVDWGKQNEIAARVVDSAAAKR